MPAGRLLRPDSVRVVFLILAICLAGGAGYFGTLGKSSYSAYSAEQLAVLEDGFLDLKAPTDEQLYSRELLRTEKQRRILFPVLIVAAVLCAIGAYLSRAARESFASAEEGARFAATVGNPGLVLEGAKNKAAALLGVTLTAPAAVIEAALAAQLASRDPDKLHGIAPDLKAMVLAQREALIKARDLLIKG